MPVSSTPRLPPPCPRYKHLKIELPDIDTADISAHLRTAFDFIEENRIAKRGGWASKPSALLYELHCWYRMFAFPAPVHG